MPGKSKFQISRSLDERIKRIINGSSEYQGSEFSQVNSAYILGFNYGNVTNCVGLTTNYQLHHAVFPVVGLVFFKTSPSDDDIKNSLKSVREFSSSPNGLGSFKSDKNEHLFLIYSVTEQSSNNNNNINNGNNPSSASARGKDVEKRIFNFTKGTFVRRRRLRLNILNDPYCPRQVHRGPDDLFNIGDNDSLSSADEDQIDHLIFFIHGVGGVCDVRFRSCAEVVADFKKMANNLLAQHSNPSSGASTPSSRSQQSKRASFFRKRSADSSSSSKDVIDEIPKPRDRFNSSPTISTSSPVNESPVERVKKVECLPVSWHSCTRRQIGMNDQLSLISLGSVPKLRHFLNKVVMDALLYTSGPIYKQTIINNVGDEINRLYTLFMEKHPNFTGSISLAGHSLGSVIVFDLLANQLPPPQHNIPEANNNECESKLFNCLNISHQHHAPPQVSQANSCMDYQNLDELLRDMNLAQYASTFQKEHIDIETLLLLTDFDMKELNLPLGARRKLGTYINYKKVSKLQINKVISLNNNEPTNSSATTTEQEEDGNDKTSATIKHNNLCDNTGQFLVNYPQLKFKPRCFFSFGSPTPMFLNIRGIGNLSKDYKLPTCDKMLNIFHPYDPLAYRIEPLIDARFKGIEPVQLPHHRGGKRIHVQLREGFARVGHDIKHRLLGSLRDTWTSFTRFSSSATTTTAPVETNPEGADCCQAAGKSGEISSSHETNCSPSVVDTSMESNRRTRLTKSASSSVDVEVESLENNLIHHMPMNVSTTGKQKRQLKRQQQFARSQSDVTNITSLDSILEGSMRHSMEVESDSEAGGTLNGLKLAGKDGTSGNERMNSRGKQFGLDNDEQRKTSSRSAKKTTSSKQKKQKKASKMESEEAIGEEFDPTKVGRLNGGRRIDYVLQEKPIELFNEYIFAFTSHASYWQNEDSALVILNEIYQQDGIQAFECFD